MSLTASTAKRVVVLGAAHRDLIASIRSMPVVGQTVVASSFRWGFGGKGANQAIAAARAGAVTSILAAIGDDADGELVAHNLTARGVSSELLVKRRHQSTGLAVVTVDDEGRNQIVVDGAAAGLHHRDIFEGMGSDDLLLVSGEVPRAVIEASIERAVRDGARVVLNLAPFQLLGAVSLAACYLVVVNETEARELCGVESGEGVELALACASATGTNVIVTCGERGSVLARPGGQHEIVLAVPAREVVDTTGAGDSYVGTLASHLLRGSDIRTAMEAASTAAALAVEWPGAQPPAL